MSSELANYPFKTLVLGQQDGHSVPNDVVQTFIDWMDESWAEGHAILIHCHAGISRTPSFFIARLMHCSGCFADTDLRTSWSTWEDEISRLRPIIQPHYRLKASVLSFFEQRTAPLYYLGGPPMPGQEIHSGIL